MHLLLLASFAHAAPLVGCERTYRTTDLTDALESAELQFTKQDADAFVASRSVVAARLACFAEPLAPEVLARVYLTEALAAFLAGEQAKVPSALAGMAAASPGFQIPGKLVPDGHPVRTALGAASLLLRDPQVVPIPKSTVGWVEVDGAHREELPTNRDVVAQRFGADGAVVETQYLRVGDDRAAWTTPAPTVATTPPTPSAASGRRGVSVRASVGVAGGGFGKPDVEAVPELVAPGARVAVGVEVGAGPVGGFVEAAWAGFFSPSAPVGAQNVIVAGGGQLRLGRVTVEAGPAWVASFVHAEDLDCAATGCGGETNEGTGSADGVLLSGGGLLGVDVALGPERSPWSLDAQGGLVTNLVRPTWWAGAGVRYSPRWAN